MVLGTTSPKITHGGRGWASKKSQFTVSGTCAHRGSGMVPTVEFLGAENKDFMAYVGRTMRLRLEEEPLHRQ